ncbi:MAG TPA: methyl-accepting chemotaxis protein [Rhodocyclaceae bacterium]|nr:methyl-accepting chemotaxis protein [Rhodocyclaceae bacterium]
MQRLRDLPIAGKLMLATVLPAAIALLLAAIVIVAYESLNYHQQKLQELSVQADILAASVSAALEFNDAATAKEYLSALRANPEIIAAGVYGAGGELVASFSRPGTEPRRPPAESVPLGHRFAGDDLLLSWPVRQGRREVGTVFLQAGLEPLANRVLRYSGILLLVMVGALTLALPVGRRLHGIISEPIRDMAAAARQIADGDLTVELAGDMGRTDEIGVLLESFGRMLVSLRDMTRQIGEVAEVLARSTVDILASATQVASASQETAAAVGQTVVTVEEVKRTAEMAAHKASLVSESTQRTAQISQTGRNSVEESIEAMERIQEQMEQVAESVVRLSEQGLAIGEIISTANELAEQSNMLSVNAAIEAAKVGELGKGFGVVAQEVKSLAEQSKQATAQVRGILGDIQKATAGAVMATEQGSKTVEAGVKLSAEAGSAIRALSQSMEEAVQAAAQIAASAQQQQAGMDQVALAMQNIRDASAQNVASSRQTETAAENLHQLGLTLKELLRHYRK